jgi:sec-independent protein translocase protein TatB
MLSAGKFRSADPLPAMASGGNWLLESRQECRRAGPPKRQEMLSVPHLIIIFLVALLVFGPEKLPELARNFGKVMAEFRRATGDLRSTFEDHMRDLEREADEHRIDSGRAQQTAPSTVAGASNAGAPANVVATTPLSARVRPDVTTASGETNAVPDEAANHDEPVPSIGEIPQNLPKDATESVLDPAASLAPTSKTPTVEPGDNGSKSEIVSDGHRPS